MFYQPDSSIFSIVKTLREFHPPYDQHHGLLTSYTKAGVAFNDMSEGLYKYIWRARYVNNKFLIRRMDTDEEIEWFEREGVWQMDFCFDQANNPFFCYMVGKKPYIYYIDEVTSIVTEKELPEYMWSPKCMLDCREIINIPDSDVVIGYMHGNKLCYALQRERFLQEHIITEDPTKTMLWRIGWNRVGRICFQWR